MKDPAKPAIAPDPDKTKETIQPTSIRDIQNTQALSSVLEVYQKTRRRAVLHRRNRQAPLKGRRTRKERDLDTVFGYTYVDLACLMGFADAEAARRALMRDKIDPRNILEMFIFWQRRVSDNTSIPYDVKSPRRRYRFDMSFDPDES